jgi:ubiquinone/menaquinone biosynthesis C-methylase UbiE
MFATQSYWNQFYSTDSSHHFDAYCSWRDVRDLVAEQLRDVAGDETLLHVGNGSSRLPLELARDLPRFVSQLVLDISPVAQRQMAALPDSDACCWLVADATAMPLRDGSVGAAFDKGTLDSLIYEAPLASAYVAELWRVLKPGAPLVIVACNVLDDDPSGCDAFLRAHPWAQYHRSLLAAADAVTGRTARFAFALRKPLLTA